MKKILVIAALMIVFPAFAMAQEPAAAPPAEATPADVAATPPAEGEAAAAETPAVPEGINPNNIPSLMFTYWEHGAVLDAKRARGSTRPPTEAELRAGMPNSENYKPPPEERELNLGGIVFTSAGEWTIWLNGKRVTPDAVPADAIELRVNKEYIDIKWFDAYTNQIFPVRLRPHQRFNFDTRIFLPS